MDFQIKYSYDSIIAELEREAKMRGNVIAKKIRKKVAVTNESQKVWVEKNLRKKFANEYRIFYASTVIIRFVRGHGIEKFNIKSIPTIYHFPITDILKELQFELENRKRLYPIWISKKKFGLNEKVGEYQIQLLVDAITIIQAVAAITRTPTANVTLFSHS